MEAVAALRAEADTRNETINYMVRGHSLAKVLAPGAALPPDLA